MLVPVATTILTVFTVGLALWANQPLTAPDIVGITASAAIDFWSLQHVAAGVLVAFLYFWWYSTHPPTKVELFWFLLLTSTLWELSEVLMEIGAFGRYIAEWYGGVEHWFNRLVIDPATVLLGGYAWKRWRWIHKPFAVTSAAWLGVNLFSPNVYYVQERIVAFFTGG